MNNVRLHHGVACIPCRRIVMLTQVQLIIHNLLAQDGLDQTDAVALGDTSFPNEATKALRTGGLIAAAYLNRTRGLLEIAATEIDIDDDTCNVTALEVASARRFMGVVEKSRRAPAAAQHETVRDLGSV
jgi:hypothetical protein